MTFSKSCRKYCRKVTQVIVFLFILATFLYSGYKIVKILHLFQVEAMEVVSCRECSVCDGSGWRSHFCDRVKEWCGHWCGSCPQPSPTQPPVPTPTNPPQPTPTTPAEPTPSEGVPTPTLTPVPTTPPGGGPSNGGGPSGNGGSWTCGATKPPTPTLLSATRASGTEVNLAWTEVNPATHYNLSYGTSSGSYQYGVANTGKTTAFSVGGLDPGTNYCFALRAVNDCMAGDLSNEICTGQVLGAATGQVLGVSSLGDTGASLDQITLVLFIIGSGCLSIGLKRIAPRKSLA